MKVTLLGSNISVKALETSSTVIVGSNCLVTSSSCWADMSGSPSAIDKEYVRLWLAEQGYKGEGRPPELPIEVRVEAATRYIDAFEQITGRPFVPDTTDPTARIRRNLGLA